jgi:hypothetical protein
MARFGRSLERLQLDDFVTSVVEVLIMERAKIAGYLMRCSHLLASASEDYIVGGINISPDLVETHRVELFRGECDASGYSRLLCSRIDARTRHVHDC